jgi:hypothetical protein
MKPSELIDQRIANLNDWRGKLYKKLRVLIHETGDVTEEWKWGTAVFASNGMVCALGAFKDHVKVNFFKGASLPDPHNLFNAGLESKQTRAIDFYENDKFDEAALTELIQSAIAHNA